ncbi:MAG: SDR family oxidoreductase [Rhodospirillum sp.]|nr:SDR family oxidoreductase [Rhodospirillum sp.]MCF8489464.1 SDR family oxidoreductase [Rhodospirillum sp.]MCF8500820.1 SDR family oxidoreductase [Rhodospirillum sp.]
MDLMLKGRKVLITGASQGIGEGLAEVFAEEGADLRLVARRVDRMEVLAERLRATFGVDVVVAGADLTHPDAAAGIVECVGDVDILVNNAGAIPAGDLWRVDAEAWRRGWDVKVMGYIDMTRIYYARMKAQGHGVILNNIGNGGENFDARYIAGSTGNAALMAFTRAIGGVSLDDNIRVIGVNPGPVATDRILKVLRMRAKEQFGDEDRHGELVAGYPLGRVAEVREIADLFAFLASPRSGYTSGTIITVDGGITSRRSIGG